MKVTLKNIYDGFIVVFVLVLVCFAVYFNVLGTKERIENWDITKESVIKTPEYMQAETLKELRKQNEELKKLNERLLEQQKER